MWGQEGRQIGVRGSEGLGSVEPGNARSAGLSQLCSHCRPFWPAPALPPGWSPHFCTDGEHIHALALCSQAHAHAHTQAHICARRAASGS